MILLSYAAAILCGVPLGFIAGVVISARIYQKFERELETDWWMREWRD